MAGLNGVVTLALSLLWNCEQCLLLLLEGLPHPGLSGLEFEALALNAGLGLQMEEARDELEFRSQGTGLRAP